MIHTHAHIHIRPRTKRALSVYVTSARRDFTTLTLFYSNIFPLQSTPNPPSDIFRRRVKELINYLINDGLSSPNTTSSISFPFVLVWDWRRTDYKDVSQIWPATLFFWIQFWVLFGTPALTGENFHAERGCETRTSSEQTVLRARASSRRVLPAITPAVLTELKFDMPFWHQDCSTERERGNDSLPYETSSVTSAFSSGSKPPAHRQIGVQLSIC